ncbi:RNA-directed DNA polymerase [Streptococcus dysgalactiae]|uniref:RNA-directed DNA polymerase n=1 Tax=Streptococcus dysgalactiae TaxID=1334 RepID=UPI0019516AC5|nr:reverse transcriptase family protein [Streptococcus dysgalactiae subsp. equisimilis]
MKARNPRSSTGIPYIILPGNLYVNSPQEISEAVNSSFAASFTIDRAGPVPNFPRLTTDSFGSVLFTLNDIQKRLSSIRPSLRPGPDGVPPALFKLGGPDIGIFLLNLFTLSMKDSTFPVQWKSSIVIPHHKKGPLYDTSCYRPINHTPIVSRLMERIVKEQIVEFLTSRNLISDRQHGFLKSRSCVTCQLDFLNHVTTAADNGKAFITVFLDMTKAFDRVSHSLLIAKIRMFGIVDPLLSWLSSYLSKRSQRTDVNGHLSQPIPITSGVIQGSVLGPLLFLLYINDVFTTINHGTPFLFADDIKIVYSFKPSSIDAALATIADDLNSLDLWCNSWSMRFSAAKSTILSYRCSVPPGSLFLNGSALPNNHIVRDLGLQYSCTFNFSEQIFYQIAKARRSIGLIHRTFRLRDSKLNVYLSHTRPLLEYCPIIFTHMRKSDRVALESVQRSFTKQLVGVSSPLNYRERCELLHLEPLWLRRLKLNLCFLFNLLHGQAYSSCTRPSICPSTPYNLRYRELTLTVPRTRLALRYKFFLVVYSTIWNKLPVDVRSCPSLVQFKFALRKLLDVPYVTQMKNYHLDIARAYEVGFDF